MWFLLFVLPCVLASDMDIVPRIAGGETADYVPYIAMLSYGDVTKFQCAGSVLTDRHILTAAHCIVAAYSNGKLSSSYMATVGTNIRDGSGQNYSLIRNYTNPEYDPNVVKNDIGILVTNTSIVFSSWVERVTLNFNTIGDGVYVVIYGWGSSSQKGQPSMELEQLEMVTVNAFQCFNETRRVGAMLGFIPPYIDPSKELCAFQTVGKGTCKGDSGSPLVCADSDLQVGLTSWGIPCALGAPDMFTRVSHYQDWILSVLDDMEYRDQLKYGMDDCN